MKNKINEVVSTFGDFDDPRINWESLKFKMREFSRDTSIKLAKARKLEWENLKFKVNIYEKIINPSEDELRDLEKSTTTLQTELSYVLKFRGMKKGKSIQILSFTGEKNRKAKTCIRKLICMVKSWILN